MACKASTAWLDGDSRHKREHWRELFLPAPDSPLGHLIDGCFVVLLLLAPLLMGGRHPWGQLTWMAIAVMLGLGLFMRLPPRRPGTTDLLWSAAISLLLFQLIPLPVGWLTSLNPGLGTLVPAYAGAEPLPWSDQLLVAHPLSINPYQTRLALGMLLAYGIIFQAATRWVRTLQDVRRLLAWVAVASILFALLALAQRFFGNGKFLWVYEHVSRDASDAVKGPFQNQNHFAHMMALGIGPLLYFTITEKTTARMLLALGGTTLCLLASLLTFSRGGILATLTAVVVTLAILLSNGFLLKKAAPRALLPALLIPLLLAIWGGERVWQQAATLFASPDLASVSTARFHLWTAHLKAIASSPWLGYGAGTHADVYRSFIDKDFGVHFTHGESGYLPLQLENGLVGSLLLGLALALLTAWAFRVLAGRERTAWGSHALRSSPHPKALAAAILGGIAASLVQSLADFVWYIPACLTTTLLLLACLYRLAYGPPAAEAAAPRGRQSFLPPRFATTLGQASWQIVPLTLLVTITATSLGSGRTASQWDAYHRSIDAYTADPQDPEASADLLRILESIVQQDPTNPLARLRYASLLLSVPPDVPTRLDPATREDKALRSALVGLRACPLDGEGYLVLEECLKRKGGSAEARFALLQQAVRLRPSDVEVLLQAGRSACQIGQLKWGLATWKPVLESPHPKRTPILLQLSESLTPEVLLNLFQLDRDALSVLYQHHVANHPDASQRQAVLGKAFARALVDDAEQTEQARSAAAWLHAASKIEETLGTEAEQVLALQRAAVERWPADYRYRMRLITLLIKAGAFSEARQHLDWCRLRSPQALEITMQQTRLTNAEAHQGGKSSSARRF